MALMAGTTKNFQNRDICNSQMALTVETTYLKIFADGIDGRDNKLVDISAIVGVDEVTNGGANGGSVGVYVGHKQLLNRFILHSGDVELSSVSLEEHFHGTINSAERVGSGGGVAGLVDNVLGEGKVHGTISGDVERSNLSGKFVVADLDFEGSVIDRDVFVGG